MLIQCAVYGEVNNGHGLRATSGDVAFAKRISGRLDLPSNPPSGVHWSPAISGFPIHDRYVIARTFLDSSASRSDFVVSQALFVSLDEMVEFSSLGRLFDCLARAPADIRDPIPIDIEEGPPPEPPLELVEAATLLVANPNKTLVKLGEEGFETLVAALWFALWPDMRREFAFRLSFGPSDLVETPKPALVSTPASLVARWHGHPLLGRGVASPLPMAAAVLVSATAPDSLRAFADDMGIEQRTLSRLTLIVRAYEMVSADATFEEIVGALRIIDHLSVDPTSGRKAKNELIARLVAVMPDATAKQMMGLRNLALPGFGAIAQVWAAAEAWLSKYALSTPAADKALTALVGAICEPGSAIEQWQSAFAKGLHTLASRNQQGFAKAIWIWMGARPDQTAAVLDFAPSRKEMEDALIADIPSVLACDVTVLRAELVKRSWLRLHGTVAALTLSAIEAVESQLAVDTAPEHSAGIAAALGKASPQEVVAIAIKHMDLRLDALATALIATTPSVLRHYDFSSAGTQRVWASAIRENVDCWEVPADPKGTRNAILMAALDRGHYCASLFAALADTPLADLSDFPGRAQIWERVDPIGGFLRATSRAWIAHACLGEAYDCDDTLMVAVLQSGDLAEVLNGTRSDVGAALNLIASLPMLREERAVDWFEGLSMNGRHLTEQQAHLLGRIILDRRWGLLLDRVKDRFISGADELRATLRVCVSMLPVHSRWILGLGSLGLDEKWESFAKVAADLYPSGPDHDDLWERCGGRNSRLPRRISGESAWRSAFAMVRKGTDVRIDVLVREMQNDFPSNPDLRFIARDRDIVGDASYRKSRW